jgi:hypothetical protein
MVLTDNGCNAHYSREFTKLLIGCTFSIFGFDLLTLPSYISAHSGAKIPLPWLLPFHIVNTLGFINVLPVALPLFSRPRRKPQSPR